MTNPSLDEEGVIELAWGLNFGSQKLREEVEDEEKIGFLLVDLGFYSNYFLTLGKHSWWGISLQQLHLLDDKVKENGQMRHHLSSLIQNYNLGFIGVQVLEKRMVVWKKHLVQNYFILMNDKPKSLGYISRRNMVQFITNIYYIAFDLLRCRDDLIDDEKQAIRSSLANLRFLMAFVQLAESTEGLGSLLNCIQDYTCKLEVLLFGFWTGKLQGERRDRLVSALLQWSLNGDEKCILEVFKMSNRMLFGEGMSRIYTLGFIPQIITDNFIKHISQNLIWESTLAIKDLKSSRSLLKDISWEHNEANELNNLISQLTLAAYELEYVDKAFVIGDSNTWSTRLWISDLIDEIKQISVKIKDVFAKQSYKNGVDNSLGTSVLLPVDTSSSIEVVVGMKEHEEKVINQLTRGSTKLGIVSIVGMGGLGKTTLAKTVFNAPLVQHNFDVRAWCCISKVYQKREILLDLLGYVIEVTPKIKKMTDDDLSNRLRQLLLERTYLIVMDDIWDMGAWKELQHSFPKDEKRSRIMFTSRNNDIASKTGYSFEPCSLDLLSDGNSWELLERKLFEGGSCPLEFREVGWEIAMKCKGLPLAVVVISGLLSAKEMNLGWWKEVAVNLNLIVVSNSETFTKIIGLSYRYLPDYLKPCFLYFAAFQEDKKIIVTNLIDLWTTEGFIRKKDDKNLNDVARDYLLELVSRNLVSVTERTSMGGIKACHVHDLLHELCWARAEEENFLHVMKGLGNSSSVSSASKYGMDSDFEDSLKYGRRRVCIYSERRNFIESRPSGQCVLSLLFFATRSGDDYPSNYYDASFISFNFKLLRTLKLDSINIGDSLPKGFELLIHLRFLAVMGTMTSIPDSIECHSNLEIFYLKGLRGEICLPHSIWSLKKLRNLRVKDRFAFSSMEDILNESDNLESLSSVFLPYNEKSTQHILGRLSRLKKLKCIFSESWNQSKNFKSLFQLESLKMLYHGRVGRHPFVVIYPATLKKLTLSKFRLPWKEISTMGSLPCLEVLKLLFKAFEGEEWEVGSEEFQNLKYLKLDSLDIVRWTTSYESFPSLQQLVVQSCKKLEKVPFDFWESSTLQTDEGNFFTNAGADVCGL